jgi:hypothetical protein
MGEENIAITGMGQVQLEKARNVTKVERDTKGTES